jgi:hypothetical protein
MKRTMILLTTAFACGCASPRAAARRQALSCNRGRLGQDGDRVLTAFGVDRDGGS